MPQLRRSLISQIALGLALFANFPFGASLPPACAAAPPAATDGVVRIVNQRPEEICLGSGTLIASEQHVGLVISCAHVFTEGVGDLYVIAPTGKPQPAVLVAVDEKNDLACLAVRHAGGATVRVARELPNIGASLASCGFGQDGQFAVNDGAHLCFATLEGGEFEGCLEMAGSTRQGDSGGPILNAEGELVGVIMGTDGETVDGTHCGRIREFLAEHPLTAEVRQEVAQATTRGSAAELSYFTPTLNEIARGKKAPSKSTSKAITTTLRGWVSFDRHAVSDARVRLSGAKSSSCTVDDSGHFVFAGLPPGEYRLEVEKIIRNRIREASQSVVVSAVRDGQEIELQLD